MLAVSSPRVLLRWPVAQLSESLARAPWALWLAVGLLVRLPLMPTTMHNDTVWMPWMAFKIVEGHWNVYGYLFATYGDVTLHPTVWAPYLPLYYLVTAGWTGLLKLIGLVDVGQWSFDTHQWYIARFIRSIFLMKVLYLPFDVVTGWAIGQLLPTARRPIAWAIWSLSPVVLVSTYMMGQNDIMPTAFVAVATVTGARAIQNQDRIRNSCLTALLLGLGAAFKSYPIFLVLPFALVIESRTREIIRFVALGLVPLLVAIAPFLRDHAFQQGVLLNDEAQRIFAAIPQLGPMGVSPFVAGYVALLIALLYSRDAGHVPVLSLPAVALLVLGLVFAMSNWVFYWLVWLMPFVAWSVAAFPATSINAIGYVVVFLGWTWNWGTKASSGLFSPVLPWATSVPAVSATINRFYPWDRVVLILQSALLGLLIGHAFILFRRQPLDDSEVPNPRVGSTAVVSLSCFVAWLIVSFAPNLVRH